MVTSAREGRGEVTPPGVLVVDDYAGNRVALEALLSPVSTVTVVESGALALLAIARANYAVVLLDVRMPSMGGLEVARRIRAGDRNAAVPIIFLTASDADEQQVLDGYAAGAVDYLRKPIDPVILRAKVSIFVELSAWREQAQREAAARARSEAERAAALEASREKDRFLAVLSHELRTPLTSILLWSEMLLSRSLSPEVTRRGLETIDRCARREAHMVENVLEMSRFVSGALTLDQAGVDVIELIDETVADVSSLSADSGVSIVWRGAAWDGPPVKGDRIRLRQGLYNLLENAVKFTPAGGRVEVTLESGPSELQIRVADTGMGFSRSHGTKLFAPFKQGNAGAETVEPGLGLGLAVTRALVELHGGDVSARSDGPGRGATFVMTLPRAGRARDLGEPALPASPPASPPPPRMTG